MAEPSTTDTDADVAPRWGLGDALMGFALAQVASTLAFAVVVAVESSPSEELEVADLPLWGFALAQAGLWLGFLAVPLLATRIKGGGARRDLGLAVRVADLGWPFALGVALQAVLVPLLYVPIFRFTSLGDDDVSGAARDLTTAFADTPVKIVLFALLIAVGAPVAEEVFFRGLVLRSLERRLGAGWALIGSTVLFGLTHFQGIQLPALLVFGGVAGVLALRTGRLGPSILLHVGFNAWTVVQLLVLTPTFEGTLQL